MRAAFSRELVLIGSVAALALAWVLSSPNAATVSADAGALNASLVLSTHLGGSAFDSIRDVTSDADGNIYLAGGADSPNFPVTPDAFDTSHNGRADVFVMKLDPDGRVLWSTFIGGPGHDRAYAVEVDSEGFVYLAGRAGSNFPVTAGAFQTTFRGSPDRQPYGPQDGFVAKVAPDGRQLVFASYFGGSDDDFVRDMAVSPDGAVYLGAATTKGDYSQNIQAAFRKGFQPRRHGNKDGVIVKVAPSGAELSWATYVGGADQEWGEVSIRADAEGNVYYLTLSDSDDVPTTPDAYGATRSGGRDFYLVKVSAEGQLVFGTFLGGSNHEHIETHHLALDAEGNAIIAAGTRSTDFPLTPGAYDSTPNGNGGAGTGDRTNYQGDAIIAKISADGTRLLASTYLGGRFGDGAEGVAVDVRGCIFVTGATFSPDFPVTTNALQRQHRGGGTDAFAAVFSADLGRLLYSTFMGSATGDFGRAAAAHVSGDVLLGGDISRPGGWPVMNPLQSSFGGGIADGVLARFRLIPQ